jgi:hypothetical protein
MKNQLVRLCTFHKHSQESECRANPRRRVSYPPCLFLIPSNTEKWSCGLLHVLNQLLELFNSKKEV